MTHVAVVGGGITGLVAAWQVLRDGADVSVLEASDRLGGKILTAEIGGRPVELGPDAFVARGTDLLELCQQLDLVDELVTAATDHAAVWTRGRLRPLPQDVVMGVPTRLRSVARAGVVSPVGVARAALDLVVPGRAVDGDRSVGDLVTARLGREVHDRLVDPLFGGIHAGPSARLSVLATAPQLAAAAGHHSLMRGVRAHRRIERQLGGGPRPAFQSLRPGLGRLVERLGEEIEAGGGTIELGAPVEGLPVADADATILAAPAPVAADLVAPASPDAADELRAIDHASVVLTVLIYPASAFPRPPEDSGFLVPHREGRLMTACSFGSTKWPHWAGPGEVVLRVSAGRFGDRRALDLSDVELVQDLHNELVAALALQDAPLRARVTRWHDAFPQYGVGHLERVGRIEAALRRDLPDVVVTGAAYRGIGIASCIAQGRAAARRALAHGREAARRRGKPVGAGQPEVGADVDERGEAEGAAVLEEMQAEEADLTAEPDLEELLDAEEQADAEAPVAAADNAIDGEELVDGEEPADGEVPADPDDTIEVEGQTAKVDQPDSNP